MMDSRCSRRFQLPADRFQSSGIFFCAARTPVDPSEKRGLPPISFRLKIFRFFCVPIDRIQTLLVPDTFLFIQLTFLKIKTKQDAKG